MKLTVEKALTHWGVEGARYELVAARENSVFRVDANGRTMALRLHRPGYRSDAELRSELIWMQEVSDGGIAVPSPIPSTDGNFLHHVDGIQVDALTWLGGDTLTASMNGSEGPRRRLLFQTLGQDMARLHSICDSWSCPPDFDRAKWDIDGLLGENPLWGRFWENPHLSSSDQLLFQSFRDEAAIELISNDGRLDFGLIHADLVPDNVLVSGNKLKMIDFDDGGFGYRLFDVATSLLKFSREDDFWLLREALVEGYASVRDLDVEKLDLFLAIRAMTYVGWNISRMDEAGALERNERFISTAREMSQNYLSRKSSNKQ